MKITRKFTTAGHDPFASVKWVKRSSKITNPDGSVVFEMDDAEVPDDLVAARHRHHGQQVLPQGRRAADRRRRAAAVDDAGQPGHRPGEVGARR